jgi:hypothetical protein
LGASYLFECKDLDTGKIIERKNLTKTNYKITAFDETK